MSSTVTRATADQLLDYTHIETIYQGTRTTVYRARAKVTEQPVVIKVLTQDYPSFSDLVQFRNQYTATKKLTIPGIIRPLSLDPCGNGYRLVMEDFGGVDLGQYIQQHCLSLAEILDIAIQLAGILHDLHQHRIIHKDIKPANILIHPDSKQVKLIDFSIASLLPKETQTLQSPGSLEGTLAYMAPEQTGRMNRAIDYRTDFYTVGVTLYQLLTGQLPFPSDDPLEVIHGHMAQLPTGIDVVNPQVPTIVVSIVAKLMAKNAEDRYQSALGLKYDLGQCLDLWQAQGAITEFKLGQRDLCDRFTIPEKLYGRETEVQALLDAFERVSQGNSELMLVAGFSGIGKTSVINEVHKPIVRQRGYFIRGKFDQFNRNIPFSAFVQAFRDLVGQLLTESVTELQVWKDTILTALGENSQVIIDLIPELKTILGPQPPAPELSGTAAQHRFNLVFQKFIQVFNTPDHPLVIFMDDLQWADSASLYLIRLLMAESPIEHLLLLGAYRDNEVFPAHPLMLTLDEISKGGSTIHSLNLAPLNKDSLDNLIADTLHAPPQVVQPLTDLVIQKTQGNPFFATQFLNVLNQDQLITFDADAGHWQCEISQVQEKALTDDIVELMVTQLQQLPKSTQEALKLAACVGTRFDLDTLKIVSEKSSEGLAASLWQALKSGLISSTNQVYKFFLDTEVTDDHSDINPTYCFTHDRIQQAAYTLIPEEQKANKHYGIGRLLLQRVPSTSQEERIFEIVTQLNYGISLISEQAERDELAQLNLIACRKAKASIAHEAGLNYANQGLTLLGEKTWQRNYELSLVFHELGAELASMCGDFEEMNRLIEIIFSESHTLLDKINSYRTKIQAQSFQNKPDESLQIGVNVLQELGVTFPENPTEKEHHRAIDEIRNLLAGKNIEDLIHLPKMVDLNKIAIVEIANSLMSAAYACNSPLYILLANLSIKLSLQYGNPVAAAAIYVTYGFINCTFIKDIEVGVKFSQVALKLLSQSNILAIKTQVYLIVGAYTNIRQEHLNKSLAILKDGYVVGLEAGNLEMAGYNLELFCLNAFWCSESLSSLEQEIRSYHGRLIQLNQFAAALWCQIYWQSTLNLLGFAEQPTLLSGEIVQESDFLSQLLDTNNLLGLHFFYLYKLFLSYLFEDTQSAKTQSHKAQHYLEAATGFITEAVFYFYDSLIALADDSGELLETTIQRVEQNQTQLQQYWAKYAPMNYQHKVDLVEAEKNRVLGNKTKALEMYERAIAGAKSNQYLQEEALANELAAKFYLNWGKEKIAAAYMQDAYYCYSRWGAKAKVTDLETRYPKLLRPILQQSTASGDMLATLMTIATPTATIHASTRHGTSSKNFINQSLDFASVLKASHSLSGIIHLDELLRQLTQIALQNSGGDRCILSLPDDTGKWQVQAIATPEATQLETVPLTNHLHLPVKLIQYVKNTQSLTTIDNLETTLPVVDDYLKAQQPKSVLCLPILNQSHLIGVVYLENKLTSEVFTEQRILVLDFLCAQAAISLENARLYRQAQHYAEQLEQSQLQVVQNEKMATLGNLVAGVAHEVNNPVGFLNGSIKNAKDYIQDLFEYLETYQSYCPPPEAVQEIAEEIDLEFLQEDLPKLLDSMKAATERIRGISTSLRSFSRSDTENKVTANLHEGLNSTLLILKYRLKANDKRPAIEIDKYYGDIPEIDCFPGQLNQVFMNILANAVDMFDEMAQHTTFATLKETPQKITIQTIQLTEQNAVEVRISDNGKGMPEEVKSRVFDHLFTTKGVGKGTGLGLAIAHQIVTETHSGRLMVNSKEGQGTEFCIQLPL